MMLNKLPSIKSHAEQYGIIAKKSLGQNFLFDENCTDKVARYAGNITGKNVLEIGPGPGGLTRSILRRNPSKLIAIEKDKRCRDLLADLEEIFPALHSIEADAMKVQISELFTGKVNIIANLPYNIGTELLFNWLKEIEQIESMTLMFQKEVAERICAKEGTKSYGKLSVMVQLIANAEKCFDISPLAFTPPPKVTSSVVSITPKTDYPTAELYKKVGIVTSHAFNMRRKMLHKSLGNLLDNSKQLLESINIDPNLRPENITVEQYLEIAKAI